MDKQIDRKNILLILLVSLAGFFFVERFFLFNFWIYLLAFAGLYPLIAGVLLAETGRIPQERILQATWIGTFCLGILYLSVCNDLVSVIGDNIIYIRDAMRLREGKSFIDTQYGIGVKTMLVPAIALFPDNVFALKAVIALTGMIFPLCSFLVLREFTDGPRAFVVAILTGSIWLSVEYASQVTADLPYPAFSLLALYITLRYIRHPGISWPWLVGACCALGWAYHVKAPAMVLVIAAVIYLLLRRQIPKALFLFAGSAVLILPWVWYLKANFPDGVGYFSAMDIQIGGGLNIPDDQIGGFWHNFFYYIFQKNPRDYLERLEYLFVPRPFMEQVAFTSQYWLVGWTFLILAVTGFFAGRKWDRRNPLSILQSLEIHDWYFMGYTAMLFTLPGSPGRYLLPVMPFLLFYIFRGFTTLAQATRKPAIQTHGPLVFSVILLLLTSFSSMFIIKDRRMGQGYGSYWKTYHKAALWARDHTPPNSKIVTRKPSLVWFWSGRESDGYPHFDDMEKQWEFLSKFDYLLLDNLPFFQEKTKYIMPLINAYPERFTAVHITEPPENYVLKIHSLKAVPANPDSAAAYYQKGLALRQEGNLEAAIKQYLKALVFAPEDPEIKNSLAVAHAGLNELELAHPLLQELVKRLPDRSDIRINFIVTLLGMSKTEEALAQCRKLLETNPNHATAYTLMAKAHQTTGNYDKAREAYQKALVNDPDNPDIRKELGAMETEAAQKN